MKHTYYFEVSAEAEMAVSEEGEPSEAYLQASFDSDKTYYTDDQIIDYIARISQLPREYLRFISKDEYERQTEEESA